MMMFHENTATTADAAWCQIQQPTKWTRYDDNLFEQALLEVSEDLPDRWKRIAERVPGKSEVEVMLHYEDLVRDVAMIESGMVEVPSHLDELKAKKVCRPRIPKPKHGGDNQWNTGIRWTEEEHMLFLNGLKKYGKGDWRSISRNYVKSRTPTQVATHAQKYFIHHNLLNSENLNYGKKKQRKKPSIHDVTNAEDNNSIDQNWVPVIPHGVSMQQSQEIQQYPSNNMHGQMGVFGFAKFFLNSKEG